MRVIADTNTVISGLLWHGPSRRVLDLARSGNIRLFTSAALLVELEDVLSRDKFAKRLALAAVTPRTLVTGFAALSTLVSPAPILPTILGDADDDAVIAVAVACQAEVIVSGDSHLLKLGRYLDTSILTASELIARFRA